MSLKPGAGMTALTTGITGAAATCRNHPQSNASDRCTGCAEPFCPNCLVEISGRRYCASCKVMAVEVNPALFEHGPTLSSQDARSALICAYVAFGGLFCIKYGLILGPVAIVLAIKAKTALRRNPQMKGDGMATAGLVMGILATILNFIYLVKSVE
jgi:hypothetical protein